MKVIAVNHTTYNTLTYHFLSHKAGTEGMIVTSTYHQFWQPGNLEQEYVLQKGKGVGKRGRDKGGGGEGGGGRREVEVKVREVKVREAKVK